LIHSLRSGVLSKSALPEPASYYKYMLDCNGATNVSHYILSSALGLLATL